MSKHKTSQKIQIGALIGPITILLTVFFILPLVFFLRNSFNKFVPGQLAESAWTLESFQLFFTDSYFLSILGRTITISVFATLLTLILGFPIAYFLARMRSKWKSYVIMLVVFPLLVGNIIRDIGWVTLLNESGLLNQLLTSTGLISEPLMLTESPIAVIIGITNVVLPFMVLTLQSVLENINPALEEAAQDLGASRFTVFKSIIFPLAVPGVVVGAIFIFVLSMNAYTTPLILGGPKVTMMAPALYSQFTDSSNWPMGSAMAVILIIVTLLTAIIFLQIMKRYTSKMISNSGVKG